jgi:hypothetical protein
MIVVRCTACDRRQLQGYRGLRAVVHHDGGITLHFTCLFCGARAVATGGRAKNRASGTQELNDAA